MAVGGILVKNAAMMALIACATSVLAASATVRETELEFKTYPFSDPDPVPATDKTRYPYFFFDGTSVEGSMKKWKAVILENDYVTVTILPEIGGKIWGAVDKKTGREFIYYNHVVKFRNISQRGPWCSGGIEFNFGIIGHGPWTATPVSYFVRSNPDGSASCFVSETELVTESTWQVEINLPADAEGFLTRTTWYNGSGFAMPYYQWMNAAYSVRGDPSFEFPGSAYIGHGGDSHVWPVDGEGRDLSRYSQNAFGGAKSEHVVNGDNGIYGIWWPDAGGKGGFGSVHLNHPTEKYGRKVWLWQQSRAGAIWEDLLTDTDGQYTELQSGRAFNQPRGNTYRTPFKHPVFSPGSTESFEEKWLVVRDRSIFDKAWKMDGEACRPLTMPEGFDWQSAYGHYVAGEQLLRQKMDREGEAELRLSLGKDPHFAPALALLASLAARRADFAKAHDYARRALAVNTYDPEANYADGVAFLDEGKFRAAKERLGLAAYSPLFRSAALLRVARAEMKEGDLVAARRTIARALEANPLDFDVRHLEIAAARLAGEKDLAKSLALALLERLPLHHGARYELNLLDAGSEPFMRYIRNELPHETLLALGDFYEAAGLDREAAKIFARAASSSPVAAVREAYVLHRLGDGSAAGRLAQAAAMPVAFALPFRRGTLPALAWAADCGGWKFRYLKAVLLAAFDRDAEADALLDACGDEPDEDVFYLYRASRRKGSCALGDLRRAASIKPTWRAAQALYLHFATQNEWEKAFKEVDKYVRKGLTSNRLNISYANALVRTGRNREAIAFLERTDFLPSEFGDNASSAWIDAWRAIAEEALAAGDRKSAKKAAETAVSYPERLGAGRPYKLNFEAPTDPKAVRNPLADWSPELRALIVK